MIGYAVTVFASAFLLFLVQPLVAKIILPSYGGSSAVWMTCMLFFQAGVVIGYFYVYLIRNYLRPKPAMIVHLLLMVAAAATLPLSPEIDAAPSSTDSLTWSVTIILGLKVGLAFLALSTTGPLIQAWQAATNPERSPYRLYALSNLGSFLALLGYPFLIEPIVGLRVQSWAWTCGFFAFALICLASGWKTIRLDAWVQNGSERGNDAEENQEVVGIDSPKATAILSWLTLSTTASVVLLATTNSLTQEVASYPFLWLLPLSLYLLSFILCFENPRWYQRRLFVPMLLVFSVGSTILIELGVLASLLLQMIGFGGVCFSTAMVCHGELERQKPSPQYLTTFYLLLSVGGFLGGLLVVVLAPIFFDRFYEFHIGLLVALLFPAATHLLREYRSKRRLEWKSAGWFFNGLAVAMIVGASLYFQAGGGNRKGFVFCQRNEYGIVGVRDMQDYREIVNGQIGHGRQFFDPMWANQPVGYYNAETGAGIALTSMRAFRQKAGGSEGVPMKVGVIGLGSGVLATWGNEGDVFRFYELNPLVEQVARNYFTYLTDSKAKTEVIVGDARYRLQQEWDREGSQQFDVLFVDAFSSDSIPVHLLTSECRELYLKHLKPDGLLVMHVTNRFVNLYPVVAEFHAEPDYTATLFLQVAKNERQNSCKWVIMTKNREIALSPAFLDQKSEWPAGLEPLNWSDDLASVASIMDFSIWIDVDAMKTGQTPRSRQDK